MGKRFDRDMLPEPASYFEAQGLELKGPGRWKTTRCLFHGGSDSMRINTSDGGWACMNCHVNGGDVLAFEMQLHGLEFLEAAERLGVLRDDGRPVREKRARTLSPAAALKLIQAETWLIVVTGLSIAGLMSKQEERNRLVEACRTVQHVMGEFA
jgi:DNA primase